MTRYMTEQSGSDLVSNILGALTTPASGAEVICEATEHKILTCNIGNITAMGCKNATLECGNISTSTEMLCDTEESVALISKMIADKVEGNPDARKQVFKNMGVTDNGGNIETYIKTHIIASCTSDISVRQSINMPDIILRDCNQVNVSAINRLDTQTRCSVGSGSQLLDGVTNKPVTTGDKTGLPKSDAGAPTPSSTFGLSMPVIIALVVGGVFLLGIAAYFIVRHKSNVNPS